MATGRLGTTPVLRTRWSKEPAGGTTSLSGLDDYSVSLVYEVGYEAVYQNGALLSRGNDYTATNGTTITLTNATVAGDIIEVFANNVVPLTDTYSQSVADGKFVNNTIVDAKGDLIVGSAADTFTRLAVGSANQVLTVDSATTSGLKWAAGLNYIGAAAYRHGTNISYTQNVETLITYSDEEFDSSGFWDSSPNPSRLTIPTGLGGKYLINFQWRLANAMTSAGVFIYKNGSRLLNGRESGYMVLNENPGSNTVSNNSSTIVDAAAGDYFTMQVQANLATNAYATWTRFSIMRLGL